MFRYMVAIGQFWIKKSIEPFNGHWSIKWSRLQPFPFLCRNLISEPIHRVTGCACAGEISAAVRVIDRSVYLSAPTAKDLGSHKRSVWTFPSSCAILFFRLFPTELIRSQLFSCSGVEFHSVPFNPHPPPPAPSKKSQTPFFAVLIAVTYS